MEPKKKQPVKDGEIEIPISDVYPVIDTDLARDNLENDLPEADLQDLQNLTSDDNKSLLRR
ncbi:hypothetical protein SDC9_210588 [bioreactor metagenome]|uniref:Uncharacterized protein n=1 Tax=bioreactor metagenome TaxID=1076179 RepID=A0A645JGN1_9ZZZZ